MLKLATLLVSVGVIIATITGHITVEPQIMPMLMFGLLTSAIILSIAKL